METKEFWLSASCYIQQAGESEPKYVQASPGAQVLVTLPAKITRKRRVKKMVDGAKTFVVIEETVDHPEHGHLKLSKQEAPKDVRPNIKPTTAKPSHEAIKLGK